MIKEALDYCNQGLSIIPIKPRDKVPLETWEPRQNLRADSETVRMWWRKWPTANIGIVTGKISGIVVVDCDSLDGRNSVNEYIRATLIGKIPLASTGQGIHMYFKHPKNQMIPNRTSVFKNVDVRGDGGYIVAPPSVHATGRTYAWASLVKIQDAPEVPPELLNIILTAPSVKAEPKKPQPKAQPLRGVKWQSEAPSRSEPGTNWLVRLMHSGFWNCGCPGYRKGHFECQHIKDKKVEYAALVKKGGVK